GGFRVRLVLGRDDGLRTDQELGKQSDAEILGGDGRQHRSFRLVQRLGEGRRDVSLVARADESASDHLYDVALVVDASDSTDEVGLVVGLDQHRRVGGQVDRLPRGGLEFDLPDLGGLAVRVSELAAAGWAALLALRTPQCAAGAAAPELARSVEPGALRLRALLLGSFGAVDQLEGRG